MSKEVFEIVRKMNLKNMEIQLVLQCAPFLTGLKISNLLIIQKNHCSEVKHILKKADISYFILLTTDQRAAFLLYDRERLEAYFSCGEVRKMMKGLGYESDSLKQMLLHFRHRYERYMSGGEAFPHEMGLLLGYPVEDVEGFIQNGGKNFLYAGYWKVYHNLTEKQQLFGKFDRAQKELIQLVSNGAGIEDIVGRYGGGLSEAAV